MRRVANTGASRGETTRALLTPDEVMNMREDELLVTMPQRPAARLTQCRDDDDPEIKRRALARGERWIPPLGLVRPDGLLEPPTFDDTLDDDEPDGPDGDDSGRAPSGGQGGDEATAGDSAASEMPDSFGDDLLVGPSRPTIRRGSQGRYKDSTGAWGCEI